MKFKTVNLMIPDDQRIGQAIINSLKESGDIHLQPIKDFTAEDFEQRYVVTGVDPFYITDEHLQKAILDLYDTETRDG